MVKLGFIVEGATEKIILEQSDFFSYLSSLKIDFIKDVENAEGNGNLLPHNIEKHAGTLASKGATDIFILTDLDRDKCITETKKRINPAANHIAVISIHEIEAWFLSDTEAIRKCINTPDYACTNPESIAEPFDEIIGLLKTSTGRGIGRHGEIRLVKRMLRNGFSIRKAAEHPNCNSAKYFLKKIKELTTL
jgi:hypothetical protein